MSTVLVAVFDDYEAADLVRQVLVQDGFPTDRVELTALRELGRTSFQPADSPHGKFVQYFRSVLCREDEREYPEMLAQRIDNGATTITVHPRGAIETERATQIIQHAHPAEVLGHDLTKHGWEHAAARHEGAWAQYVWLEHSPNDPDCIYCRLFPHLALHAPAAFTAMRSGSAYTPAVGGAPLSSVADPGALAGTAQGGSPAVLSRATQFQHFGIRRVSALQSLEWLRRGWDDLRHIRSASLIYGVLIATLGAVLLIVGSSHLYFFAAAVSGYLLIGPLMTTGVCELSRRRAAGEPLGFDESLQGVIRNPHELLKFGAILAAVTIVWFVSSEAMLRSVLHSAGPAAAQVLWGGFTESANRAEIIAYVGSGAVLAGIVFAVSVVAVPLIIDRHANVTEAIWGSLKATLWNLPTMLIWSALIVALTALGFLTMLLGMVFVAPLLGHATWHAYRDLVE
jgi:uncharacterized membrane protein